MGGAVKGIAFMSREIERSAYEAQRRIESGEDVVVGLNRFEDDDEVTTGLFEHDLTEEDRLRRELTELRTSRDAAAVDDTLQALKSACGGTDNLIPPILACMEAYATVGEVCRTMETVFGIYREGA